MNGYSAPVGGSSDDIQLALAILAAVGFIFIFVIIGLIIAIFKIASNTSRIVEILEESKKEVSERE